MSSTLPPIRPLTETVWAQAEQRPDATAVRTPGGEAISYRGLVARAERVAQTLRSVGIEPGMRVAVQADKCPDFLAVFLGTVRAGAVFVPINPANTAAEIDYYLTDSGATAFIGQPQRFEEMEPVARDAGVRWTFTLATD